MHRRILFGATLLVGAALAAACRQDEPAGDPKTPADLPLPSPDKTDNDKPASPKLPSMRDAG